MDKLIENWPKFAVDVGTHLGLTGRLFGVVILILLYPVLYAGSRRLVHATFDRLLAWIIKEDLNFNKRRLAKRLALFFFACVFYGWYFFNYFVCFFYWLDAAQILEKGFVVFIF